MHALDLIARQKNLTFTNWISPEGMFIVCSFKPQEVHNLGIVHPATELKYWVNLLNLDYSSLVCIYTFPFHVQYL